MSFAGKSPSISLILTFFVAFAPPAGAAAGFDAARFERIVEDGMTAWHVPGMAVAVIDDGKVVFQRGFGVTTPKGGEAIDEHTLFANASTLKAMVVAGILMLADDGKLSLDDLVIQHVPELHFGDASLTQQLTLRDLLAHRTGLPSTDFWTFAQTMTLDEQIHRLREVEPIAAPRTRLIYQNTMYEIAGLIIERTSGKPWYEFLTERLWRPIGMNETFGSRAKIRGGLTHVLPHDFLRGVIRQVEWDFPPDLADAAGSAWLSIYDMSRWAQFILRGGVTEDGTRLISEEGMHNMFEPQQLATPDDFYPTVELTKPHWRTYGLGWFQQDFQGRAIDFHTGSLSGMIAIIGLDREAGKAVVVLGNRDHAEMRHALLWEVMDDTNITDKRNWNQDVLDLYRGFELEDEKEWEQLQETRIKGTKPRLPIADYAGTYRSTAYGDIRIAAEGTKLAVHTAMTEVEMSHWHQDTFLATHPDWRYGSLAVFGFGTDGGVKSVEIFGNTFTRIGETQ
jgi:CubicO group peptidase (beta-lactamase class C family)